ncbi:MAG: hypothetical protein WC322_06125 [Candidatus Paceibacterota bacterium]|jgi:hypothetical protein
MKTEFLTPVGRLVQGDPFEPQTKNMQGQPLMTMSGQPTQRYFIAVAFKKDDAAFGALYQKLVEVARASFPTLFNAQGQCSHPRFSWKLMDGDGVDDNGKSNATKEGFAGHWVLKFSSSFAPRCFHAGHYQPHEQIQDPKAIQRGYFVRVAGSIEGNDNPQKPGLYVNLGMVELAGVGPIISSGPDASAVFGGSAPQLPAGAQPLPMNAGMPAAPAMPGFTPPGASLPAPAAAVPGFAPPNAAAPAALPATTYPTSVPPNPAFLAGPGGVAAAPAMPGMPVGAPAAPMAPPAAPVAPPVPQMTAAAGGATYEQFRAQGWTDEQMRAQGFML